MNLLDAGLEALIAPRPEGVVSGVVALGVAASLAAVGMTHATRKALKELPIYRFPGKGFYETKADSVARYVAAHNLKHEPLGNELLVWADWAITHGEQVGEAWQAAVMGVPCATVEHAGDCDREDVSFCIHNVDGLKPEDAPDVMRLMLERLGFDSRATVADWPWTTMNRANGSWRNQCQRPSASVYLDQWSVGGKKPCHYGMATIYRDGLPKKKVRGR